MRYGASYLIDLFIIVTIHQCLSAFRSIKSSNTLTYTHQDGNLNYEYEDLHRKKWGESIETQRKMTDKRLLHFLKTFMPGMSFEEQDGRNVNIT